MNWARPSSIQGWLELIQAWVSEWASEEVRVVGSTARMGRTSRVSSSKGSPGWSRIVNGVERPRAKPVGEQRLDLCGSSGVGGQRVVVASDGGDEHGVGGGAGVAGRGSGDEEVGVRKPSGRACEEGGGDAGGFGDGHVGVVADGGELLAAAAEEGGVGGRRVLHRKA